MSSTVELFPVVRVELCWGECCDDDEVAMTRNVVLSKRITSVALHASANVERCLVRIDAFGIRV